MDGALLGAHLDGDAAFEVDAEVEADHEDADQRQQVDRRRQRERDLALAHEIEVGAGADEVVRSPQHGVPQMGSSVGRFKRTQVASSMRVKMVAVKRWVKRPRVSDVAKPRIGPEPKPNSRTPAISAVRLESMTAVSARS